MAIGRMEHSPSKLGKSFEGGMFGRERNPTALMMALTCHFRWPSGPFAVIFQKPVSSSHSSCRYLRIEFNASRISKVSTIQLRYFSLSSWSQKALEK